MGMPIATIVPKAKLRMIIAAMMPTSSLLSVSGFDSSDPIEPPGRDLHAGAPHRVLGDVEDLLRLRRGQVGGADVQQHRDERGGALSFAICAAPFWLKGLGALTTSGCFCEVLGRGVDGRLRGPRVDRPGRRRGRRRALAVLLRRELGLASRSVARWLSVPGRVRSLVVSAPTRQTSRTIPTMTAIHASSTGRGWRATPSPMRWRNAAIGGRRYPDRRRPRKRRLRRKRGCAVRVA